MSWSQALRRPRIHAERRQTEVACPGDAAILRALAGAVDRWTPSAALGGSPAMQAIYRLRNTHGADIIQTMTGLGYKLTPRGLSVLASLQQAREAA